MSAQICTLFEGHYHHGLAALTNSLVAAGFRGDVVAGYRGPLPAWAERGTAAPLPAWPQARALAVAPGVQLRFVPLSTTDHLTNHKPEFMLALLDGGAGPCRALYYLDPDICIAQRWRFFEEWVQCGVALCEDMNSPLPERHPRRMGWRRFYGDRGLPLRFRMGEYVNGGFVGLRQEDREFLLTWQRAMTLMGEEIGGLASAKIEGGRGFRSKGFADCFDCSDQDALNAAVEASACEVSVIGQEAMGFKPGALLLPHAVGRGKPWERFYLRAALGGRAPGAADKAFWQHVAGPLCSHGAWSRACHRLDLRAASAIGRVLRRA